MSQIKNKFIEAASGSTVSGVTDVNIRLRNAQPLRARNAANSADVNILSVSASDVITMAGPLSMGTNKITDLVNPTAGSQEAATANYVDSAITSNAANRALSNLSSVAINTSLLPATTNSIDLGSLSLNFRNGYVRTLIDSGSANTSISVQNRTLHDPNGTAVASFASTLKFTLTAGVGLDVSGSTSGAITIKAADTTTNYSVKMPATQGAASTVLTNDGSGNLSWSSPAASGVTTVGTFSGSSQTNGASISGTTITFGPADATNPGMVSTGAQNFAGAKTFNGNILSLDSTQNIGSAALPFNDIRGLRVIGVNSVIAGSTSGNSGRLLATQTMPSGSSAVGAVTAQDSSGFGIVGVFSQTNSNADAVASSNVLIETGNKTAGTGNSGDISLQTGTSSGGTRGSVTLNGQNINLNAANQIFANSKKIVSLADPTSAQDAATKAYVDAVAQGLKPKAAVRVATTTNGTLASSFENGDVIDGVTLATGNRILIKDQTTQSENGIYVVNASGAPTRAADFDSVTPIDEINGAYTLVQFGTVNAGTGWVETATVVTVGTDPIVFQQFTAASTIIGGDMITVSGSTVSVDLATTSGLESTNPGNASGQLRAKVNAATMKINGSNELEGLKQISENLTLNGTDITNQYKDLSFAVYGTSASVNSVVLSVVGGPVQQKTVDYTVSLTGGSGGVTRITFAGDLATGGAAALVSGDILMVSYSYLT